MKKTGIVLIFMLVIMIVDVATAQNATIAGTKFYDYDQDGVLDGHDFGLSGWTVYLTFLNGTAVPGASTVTGTGGNYSLPIATDDDYYIREVLKPGWINTTNATERVELVSCGDGGDEFFTNASSLNVFMPNLPDGQSYILLGWNARIGDSVSELGPDVETQIFYPLGQWNAGQSSSSLDGDGEVDWVNNTYVPFDAGWTPGATLYETASWNVRRQHHHTDFNPRPPQCGSYRDILIRLHSEDGDFLWKSNNLTLTQGIPFLSLVNSHLIFNQTGSGATTVEDLYLLVHASDILES